MPGRRVGAGAFAPVRRAGGGRPRAPALAVVGAAAVLAAAALTAACHGAAQPAATSFATPHGVAGAGTGRRRPGRRPRGGRSTPRGAAGGGGGPLRSRVDEAKAKTSAAQARYDARSVARPVDREALERASAELAEQKALLRQLEQELKKSKASEASLEERLLEQQEGCDAEAEVMQAEAEAARRAAEARQRELTASLEGRGEEVSRAEARQRQLEALLESKEGKEREMEAVLERKGRELAEAERSAAEAERARAAADARYGGMLAMLKVVGDRAQEATGGEPLPDLAAQREAAREATRANERAAAEAEEEIKLARGRVAQMRASLDSEMLEDRGALLEAAKARVKTLNKALRGIAKDTGAYDAGNLFGFLDSRSGEELVQDILTRVDALKKKGRQ